jgi:nucleotide-binding universal stress UspA family protein
LIIEAALFSSGRPVLVVTYIQKAGLKVDRVMVCWDGSRNAARAVADAMPLLKKAKLIDVVTVDSRERRNDIAGVEITEHLARHGIMVELKPIVASDSDVASAILSYAADASIDLIIMGGYGHSRLREFILGGATRGMLEAMTVPTLMAH